MSRSDESRVRITGSIRGDPIHVVAISLDGVREALTAATAIAHATDARVFVIAQAGVEPWPWDAAPTDAAQSLAETIRKLPEASSPVVDVVPMLGRQPTDVIPLLPPRALVFIGGAGGRFLPSPAQRVAHAFARLGCRVLFVHASPASRVASEA